MKYKVRVGSGAAMHWVEVEADSPQQAEEEVGKQYKNIYGTELVKFNPYDAIAKYKGLPSTSGINWSYAEFTSKANCEAFAKECNDNGYRTRSMGSKSQSIGPDTWHVQYHHYAD